MHKSRRHWRPTARIWTASWSRQQMDICSLSVLRHSTRDTRRCGSPTSLAAHWVTLCRLSVQPPLPVSSLLLGRQRLRAGLACKGPRFCSDTRPSLMCVQQGQMLVRRARALLPHRLRRACTKAQGHSHATRYRQPDRQRAFLLLELHRPLSGDRRRRLRPLRCHAAPTVVLLFLQRHPTAAAAVCSKWRLRRFLRLQQSGHGEELRPGEGCHPEFERAEF